jgi:RNA polymerase sigma factor (sigma-70 family)
MQRYSFASLLPYDNARDSNRRLESKRVTDDNRCAELEELIPRLNHELVNYIYRWVRCRDTARDIAQEAFLRVYALSNRNDVVNFRSFLYQTARNIAIDWIRKRAVRQAFAAEEASRTDQGDLVTPDRICLAKEEVESVKRAFVLLPPRTQMAIMLIREGGLSYDEVGQKLSIKTHSARRLVERAMRLLLDAVSQEGGHARGKR